MIDGLLRAPAGTVLSLNVPDLPAAQLRELREARLARFGIVPACVAQRFGDDGAHALHATIGELEDPPQPGHGCGAARGEHPTLTELTPLHKRPGVLERLHLRPRP